MCNYYIIRVLYLPRNLKLLISLSLYLWASISFALPEDKAKKAYLLAQSVELNQQTHQGIYIGEVTFDQGTTHLRADKATTLSDPKNKLLEARAYGNTKKLAHYWTKTAPNKPELHAFAEQIHYYPPKHLVVLIGQARVLQGEDSLSADKICFDTLKKHVTSSNKQSKTIIIIHPGKKHDAT
ncbi:MAG: lipopolysaccharide transport periplasmic protein LptA [Legionellaceae bacterium]|nr:lipopolysaccharide transport periplasmic protein LptA [Legionellaceae bacterium]HCA89108.1 lipopolysaccharide transport periplasmic protein LptA [Legionellales bacterium]